MIRGDNQLKHSENLTKLFSIFGSSPESSCARKNPKSYLFRASSTVALKTHSEAVEGRSFFWHGDSVS